MYRNGHSNARNIYRIIDPENYKGDEHVAVAFTPEVAVLIVKVLNRYLADVKPSEANA